MRSHDLERAKFVLADVCKRGGHQWTDIVGKIASSYAQLWDYGRAMLVTEVTIDDKCHILLAGGSDARDWIGSAEAELAEWARAHGCAALSLRGRRGWAKLLPHWIKTGFDGDLIDLELAI